MQPHGSPLEPWAWDAIHGDDEWASVEGTFGFVDVSGFTRMSERFARASRTSADVDGVLNGIFGRLVDVVLDWGGDVLQFGGDALALWFAGDGQRRRGRVHARPATGTALTRIDHRARRSGATHDVCGVKRAPQFSAGSGGRARTWSRSVH